MILTLTLLSALLLGYELSLRVWGVLAPAERATYAVTIGVLIWLASAWTLSLLSLLRPGVLVARTALLAISGLVLLVLRRGEVRRLFERNFDMRSAMVFGIVFAPLGLWVVFGLWRGALLPPLNHDALSYHLTKAALFVREGGFRTFDDLAFFIPPRASNYEMLLADALASDGSDRLTEWPSVVFYLGFIAAGVALAQRWWRSGARTAAAMAMLLGGIPVLLLHSAAHKNDLLLSFFVLAALVALGRALSQDDTAALALSVAAFGAAAATKNHGALIAVVCSPVVAWCLFRRFRWRRVAIIAVIALLSVVLLGGIDQVVKLTGATSSAGSTGGRVGLPRYGDWQNLWQGPYLLVAAPLEKNAMALNVPWDANRWFWRRYELFFSHFGVVFSAAAVAFPLMLLLYRRSRGEGRLERYAITAVAVAAFLALLPVAFAPTGMYLIYMPRFVLFLVPIVFCWTVAPLFDFLESSHPRRATAALLAATLLFGVYAADNAVNDAFAPIEYVAWARERTGVVRAPAFHPDRACFVVDRLAGPRDTVLIDASYGAWVYPIYGATLERDVRYVTPGNDPPVIADDVDWVVIDRGFVAVWEHPALKNLGQASRYLGRAKPRPEDSRVLKAVSNDSRFELVRMNQALMQAVFRRRR